MPPNERNLLDEEKDGLLELELRRGSVERKNDFESEDTNKINDKDNEKLADKVVDNANKYFLVKILSPEITENEKKKREHKDELINIVKIFLIVQFMK